MRAIIILCVCVAAIALFIYSAREEEKVRILQRRRTYYLGLLRAKEHKKHEERSDFLRTLETTAGTPGWQNALDVAKIYHRGCYPNFKPNAAMASSLFHALLSKCDDPSVVAETQGLLHQHIVGEDIAGNPLPLEPGHTVLARINSMIYVPPVVNRVRSVTLPTVQKVRMDPQNSHDHGVTSSIKTILCGLQDGGDAGNAPNVKEEVEKYLLSESLDMTDESKAKALTVLESLQDTHVHSALGMTEIEALGLVWSKLRSLDSPDALETMCKQLESGFERGVPVCSTGKIARIVSALDGVTEQNRITPMWVVRDEMGSLASKIRSETLAAVSALRRAAYDRGDAVDVEERMTTEFTRQALKTYVDDLGMEQKIVQPIIDDLVTGF